MLDILFLGTGASVPSKDRSLPGVAVRSGSEIILFDCGEGTQRQFMFSRMSFMKVSAIFISHMHGDHTLGLPGLLQTMGMSGRQDDLVVFGPKGIEKRTRDMISATEGEIPYDLYFMELVDGNVYDLGDISVECFATDHEVESYGFLLREKDRIGKLDKEKALKLGLTEGPDLAKIQNGETVKGVKPADVLGEGKKGLSLVYSGDTRKCPSIPEIAKGCDVVIHESTYMESESALAVERFHCTAKAAAETAKECGARYLFLIHISNRYKNIDEVVNEAKKVFPETCAPNDLQIFSVTDRDIRSA